MGIKPIYVFDGIPPSLKSAEIERRKQVKVEATVKYEKAVAEGKPAEARMYAQAATSMKDYMQEDSRKLLDLLASPSLGACTHGKPNRSKSFLLSSCM